MVADFYHSRVVQVNGLLHAPAAEVAVGAARVAKNHGEVAVVDALGAHGQVVLGAKGYVVWAVLRRRSVFGRIHTKHREIARVAGPHPVVGVSAVFAYTAWGSPHQAHVIELLIDEQIKLVAMVECLNRGLVVGSGRRCFGKLRAFLLNGLRALRLGHFCVEAGIYGRRYVLNSN